MKIRATYETETYICQGGYFAIKQDQCGEDQIIMLSPSQCELVIEEMKKAVAEQGWWSDAVSEENTSS